MQSDEKPHQIAPQFHLVVRATCHHRKRGIINLRQVRKGRGRASKRDIDSYHAMRRRSISSPPPLQSSSIFHVLFHLRCGPTASSEEGGRGKNKEGRSGITNHRTDGRTDGQISPRGRRSSRSPPLPCLPSCSPPLSLNRYRPSRFSSSFGLYQRRCGKCNEEGIAVGVT